MNSSTIEITERSVNDLRPPERSVRTHNRAQERKLTRIIRKHGIVAPIIVDPNGNIINGELVWKCSKKLGFESVPTVVAISQSSTGPLTPCSYLLACRCSK